MDGDDLDDHGWSELSYEVGLIVEDYFARADADDSAEDNANRT